ncbi:MAG: DNA polymerase I [Phycisphaerales bacterium]|nr:DNA polymerase I [Phycisphaerales bacterium]
MAKRLFIIDGLSQIFRCYYAPFRQLTAPSGEPTRATYVFSNMLLQLIREHQPDYLAMAMDSDEGTVFRREIDPQYKANREPPPEDLIPQIHRILQIVATQGIPILARPGFEADDVLATLCQRLAEQEIDIIMVSRDKDLDQLLSERVRLFDPLKGELFGPEELHKKKGYGPEQAVEVQTLCGDSTDNIMGVKGVGPKKAAALIAKYGSAAAVIEHADELTPAMRQNVLAFAEHLDKTRQLVTLRRDVPLDFDLEACRFKGVDYAALKPIFAELDFRRLLDLAAEAAPDKPSAPITDGTGSTSDRRYILVDNETLFADFLDQLRKQKIFAMDTETTSLRPAEARLVGMSFSWKAHEGYYLPLAGVGNCLPFEPTLDALRPILADATVAKVGQNIKYDLAVLAHHGVPVAGVRFDCMIASFVLDSTRRSHGMDALARELLGVTPIPITDLIGKGKNQISFDSVSTDRAAEYAAEDADITWRLYQELSRQLEGSDLEPLFRETEMPLVEVLTSMEVSGVKLDTAVLARMSRELADRLSDLTRQIHEHVGHSFNIDSTKALSVVLFDELKLPIIKKTATGAGKSTDAETLEALAWQTNHPVPALVKEYRELAKLKNTYIDTLPQMISRRTGRIHASFNQTAAVTGRLSSSEPNLQNIPIRTELGREIRRAFVAADADHVLLTADYSQIELRVLAHFSQDRVLKQAFVEDRDIHQFVAAQVFGVPLEEVTREQRGRAKAVNFGIIYGQSAFGLSRTTGMPVGEAQNFINMYFLRYPGIRLFMDQVIDEAKRKGYVQTILGRRRAIADLHSRNRNARQLAERMAVNTVIQGSAADLIKRAMISIHRRIIQEGRPIAMLIQVHDELVFDTPRAGVEEQADFVRHEMCNALPLDVPVKVDLAWGDNWLESK